MGEPLRVVRTATAGTRLHIGVSRLPCIGTQGDRSGLDDRGGYAFLTELVRRLVRANLRVVETPIVFRDRRHGTSKMSARIVAESMWLVTTWALRDRGPALSVAVTAVGDAE